MIMIDMNVFWSFYLAVFKTANKLNELLLHECQYAKRKKINEIVGKSMKLFFLWKMYLCSL